MSDGISAQTSAQTSLCSSLGMGRFNLGHDQTNPTRRGFIFRGIAIAGTLGFCPPLLSRSVTTTRIYDLWSEIEPKLREQLTASLSIGRVQALYQLQLSTANLLIWADRAKEIKALTSLADVYSSAFEYARTTREVVVHDGTAGSPERPAVKTIKRELKAPKRLWTPLDDKGEEQPENTLISAQFIYGVLRMIRATVHTDPRYFSKQAFPLVLDHIGRWLENSSASPGYFQVAGWKCSQGNYSHLEHLENLFGRIYGQRASGDDRSKAAYCNALTDTDLFIIMIVLETVALAKMEPQRYRLEPDFRERIDSYCSVALPLLMSRFAKTEVRDWFGTRRTSWLLDPGIWDEYPDFRYSGYNGSAFPGKRSKGQGHQNNEDSSVLPEIRSRGVGWDISHGRRFVLLLDTLEYAAEAGVLRERFPLSARRQIALQLAFGPWDKSKTNPRFANYLDGTNGWYRVNYGGRNDYGIPPFGLDKAYETYGYAFITEYAASIKSLMKARTNAEASGSKSETPEIALQSLTATAHLLSS